MAFGGAAGYTVCAMSTQPDDRDIPNRVELSLRAIDNLAYIRQTIERSAPFTAVPGWGLVGMGVIGGIGSIAAAYAGTWWLWVWMAAASLATAVGGAALAAKCVREYGSVFAPPARRFALNLIPPIAAGAVLTFVFHREGLDFLLPGVWLLLYGVGVLAAGAHSVRVVPIMGVAFIAAGAAVLTFGRGSDGVLIAGPVSLADLYLTIGFGLLHVLFGLVVARRYGG